MVYEAVKTNINDQVGVAGVHGKGHLGVSFLCVVSKWVVGCGGIDGYFGDQGLPVGIHECLERFHGRWVDYLFQNGTA